MTDERKDQLTAEADGLIEGRNADTDTECGYRSLSAIERLRPH